MATLSEINFLNDFNFLLIYDLQRAIPLISNQEASSINQEYIYGVCERASERVCVRS